MTVQNLMPPPTQSSPPPLMPNPNLNGGRPPRRVKQLLNLQTLLGRFQGLAALVIILAGIALIFSFFALSSTTSNFRQVVNRLGPSIDASQQLGQALQEMDARAADYQLTSRIDVTSPDFQSQVYGLDGLRAQAWNELQARRVVVDNKLNLLRSKVDPNSKTETDAINIISNRFYDYYAQLNLMKYELDLGRKEAALANYKAAHDILAGSEANYGIAANIKKLSDSNLDRLNKTDGPINPLLMLVIAGLVVLMVGVIAVYYAYVTHRLLNFGFALAVVVGLAAAVLLVAALNAANNDYRKIRDNDVRSIVQTSTIQQLSADAGADLSRLLLSPDSPGLDSTNPVLTSDVKAAFARDSLIKSYNDKRTRLETELRLSQGADTAAAWTNFTARADTILKKYDGKLLADAILINIGSQTLLDSINTSQQRSNDNKLVSARKAYTDFSDSINRIASNSKQRFDKGACDAVGDSEFGQGCAGSNGYLNMLQIVVWVAFPLVALLIAAGVWYASRLF